MSNYNETVNDYLEQIIEDLDECNDEKVVKNICQDVKNIRNILGIDDYTDYGYSDYEIEKDYDRECDGCDCEECNEDEDDVEEYDYEDCEELTVKDDGRLTVPKKILDEIGVDYDSSVNAVFDEDEQTITVFADWDDAVQYVDTHPNSYMKEYTGKTIRITVKNFFDKDTIHCDVFPNEYYAVLF